jgi:hypothetical protein
MADPGEAVRGESTAGLNPGSKITPGATDVSAGRL